MGSCPAVLQKGDMLSHLPMCQGALRGFAVNKNSGRSEEEGFS